MDTFRFNILLNDEHLTRKDTHTKKRGALSPNLIIRGLDYLILPN